MQGPRNADPLANLRIGERMKESRKRNRQALAPYVLDCLRDSAGNAITRIERKERQQALSSRLTARL
jgi:hypothetical protein